MKDCIFCKIVNGEAESKKVYEDADAYAFHDINPQAPVHILIVPKKHIKNLADADEKDQEILGKIQLIGKKIAEEKEVENFRFVTANGSKAGQTVFHLHYHLMGGWKDKSAPSEEDMR